MANIWLCITCLVMFLGIVELRPQGFPFHYHQQEDQFRSIRGTPTENIVRKDFYVHEIPQEIMQDDLQEEMHRRQREQFELDRFVLKMYEEFRKRERDGTLNKYRLF